MTYVPVPRNAILTRARSHPPPRPTFRFQGKYHHVDKEKIVIMRTREGGMSHYVVVGVRFRVHCNTVSLLMRAAW